VSTRFRRLLPTVSLIFLVLVAACGRAEPSVSPSPSAVPASAPSLAASGAASAPADGGSADTQTDTEWGRIWDGVPAGFPRFPGSIVADGATPEPVSATYSVANDDTAVIATWMQTALENASFRTEALSGPLEDGSFVLDSVGAGECRVQVAVEPMGGLTFVTVRYGAACPAG